MDTHRKFSKKSSMLFCLLVSMKEPDEICYTRYRDIREENSFFESIQKKIDYSLGGYYQRGRWARTRRYYEISYYLMNNGKDNLFEPILATRFRL
jgi:hypothetical protein